MSKSKARDRYSVEKTMESWRKAPHRKARSEKGIASISKFRERYHVEHTGQRKVP